MTYDPKQFIKALDVAIGRLRMQVAESLSELAQPRIDKTMTPKSAMVEVVRALILRRIRSEMLDEVLASAREMLIAKNDAYGNSALDPVRIFSKASTKEQLLVRLDDKVSRLARGQAAGEDVAADMLGYLILLEMADAEPQNRREPGGVIAYPCRFCGKMFDEHIDPPTQQMCSTSCLGSKCNFQPRIP